MKNKTVELPKLNNIQYVKGDATVPQGEGNKVIVHCVNNIGLWGKGFVMALSARWPEPEQDFRELYKSQNVQQLGTVAIVPVTPDIVVANLYAQEGIYPKNDKPPIRYKAMNTGLDFIGAFCKIHNASLHMPRIGCGLAKGDWNKVAELIERNVIYKGVTVTVYDMPRLLH